MTRPPACLAAEANRELIPDMFRNPLSLLALVVICGAMYPACSGGRSPVDVRAGDGTLDVTVGPAGAVIEGRGGTRLEGLTLRIPADALRQLVRLRIRAREDIDLPDTDPMAVAVEIRAEPDPGALAVPAELQMVFEFPEARDPSSLFVAGRQFTPRAPSGTSGSGTGLPVRERPGLAAELGTYDRAVKSFTAEIGSLADLQVRATRGPRNIDDANALVSLALTSFNRLTDESLTQADRQIAAALKADPYFPAARLLRAVTRVMVVCNDRGSNGPGLQSIGEAATAFGLDLSSRSLLRRVVDGAWPTRANPGSTVPAVEDVLEMLQSELRPALEAGLDDLAFVPPHSDIALTLPAAIIKLSGEREVDAADHFFLRSLFAFTLYALDALEDTVVTVDIARLLSSASARSSLQDVLAQFPNFGEKRTNPATRTSDHLAEALFSAAQAFALLNSETDDQADDMIVFSSSFDDGKRDRWQGNLQRLFQSFAEEGAQPILSSRHPAVFLDAGTLLTGLDARRLMPAVFKFVPLAGTLPDPTFQGLFAGQSQDDATCLLRFANRVAPAQIAVTIDGDVRDWPAASEALLPTDASGDSGELPDLDLARVFLGLRGDDLVCRLSLASGAYRHDPRQTTVYGFTLRPDRQRPAQTGPSLQVLVEMTATGPEVTVRRDGVEVTVAHEVAVRDGELELALDRFDLYEPDEPVRDRVFRAFSRGMDVARNKHGGDETRRILFRF